MTTKNELARIPEAKDCCRMAMLGALLRMDGCIQISGRRLYINVLNQNAAVARKIFSLFKDIFGIKTEVLVQRKVTLKKNNVYLVRIPPQLKTGEILSTLGLVDEKGLIIDSVKKDLLKKECCRQAYLRGVFLGGGSVNNPEGAYHLEIITASAPHARDIRGIMRKFGLDARINFRKHWYVVYLKESEQIINCLNIMGAHSALLDFENKRIFKDMRNQVNRLVNCETANLNKTVDAAVKQQENIRYIASTIGLAKLPHGLRQVAEARLDNPEASLKELGEMLSPQLGKSGVNHRLRRIEEIAGKIKESGEKNERRQEA